MKRRREIILMLTAAAALFISALIYTRYADRMIRIFALFFAVVSAAALFFLVRAGIMMRQLEKNAAGYSYAKLKEDRLWKLIPFHEELSTVIDQELRSSKRKNEMEVYDRQAALSALQSQINPHFLYNTLESVRGQAIIDGNEEIAVMLEKLGSFFRYSISRKENIVTLLEEIQNLQGYMYIQNYRFSGRYKLDIEYLADERVNRCYVPKLMMQPIAENSIIHAFTEKASGTITVTIDEDDEYLLITMSDDGCGMNEQDLAKMNAGIEGKLPKRPDEKHNGIALENVNSRIQVLFGEQYGIHAYSTLGHGTDIEIFLPKIFELRAENTDETDHL